MIQKFTKLLSPGAIGRMKVRNRIVMPAMARNYATLDGRSPDNWLTIILPVPGAVLD